MSPLTKPTTCIEDLPPEMISELFEYLPPKDLAACSMVSKRWHSIYAAFRLLRLVVTNYDSYYGLSKWKSSNRPILERELCSLAMFGRWAEKPLLSNLKHLVLSGSFEFDLSELNRFQQLVHLEIIILWSKGKVQLNLPRLKILAFHEYNDGAALSIDCPELSTLLYYEMEDKNFLDVKQPETIRRLETSRVNPEWLAQFKRVECLVAFKFRAISKATLLSLPELRELRYNDTIEDLIKYTFSYEIDVVDRVKRVKQTVSKFVDEAKKLKGRDFRFTFSGFDMTNVNVDQIDFGVQDEEENEERVNEQVCKEYIYMKNYRLIEPDALHFVYCLNYTSLMSSVTGEFPRCFPQKFTGIDEVQVDGVVEDPDHLLWFLKSLKFLRNLEFTRDAGLSQEFYDQLPASARSLVSLDLGDQNSELHLNFDFIAQFSHLSDLKIYRALSLRSAISLVRWLGRLKEASIHFQSGEDRWIMKERDSTLWKITNNYSRPLFEDKNPDQIVNFLRHLGSVD